MVRVDPSVPGPVYGYVVYRYRGCTSLCLIVCDPLALLIPREGGGGEERGGAVQVRVTPCEYYMYYVRGDASIAYPRERGRGRQ
eukprot:scaffold1328_cov394-Prasinococcus_capsulatus_cf.AAC.17